MMNNEKKILSVFILLISFCIFGQKNQFIYDYKFKMDSLNRAKFESELMILETSSEGSKFYSYVQYVYDSSMTATFKKADMTKQNHFDFTGLKNAKIKFTVSKKYPNYNSLLRTSIGSTRVTLEENNKFDWKIESQKDKILGYNVQKATTYFKGRKWIAWFTNEIPIQDGPYRFWGLPGLILKLEDTKGDHTFTIVGTKNIHESINQKLNVDKTSKDIIVTEEKFNNLWNEYKKDPAKDVRQQNSSNSSFSSTITFNGKTYSNDEIAREIEKEVKEKLKTENNYIELHLYK